MTNEVVGRTSRLLRAVRLEDIILGGSDGMLPVDPHQLAQSDVTANETASSGGQANQQHATPQHTVLPESSHILDLEHPVSDVVKTPDSLSAGLEAARTAIHNSLDTDHLPDSHAIPSDAVLESHNGAPVEGSVPTAYLDISAASRDPSASQGTEHHIGGEQTPLDSFSHGTSEAINSAVPGIGSALNTLVHSTVDNLVGHTIEPLLDGTGQTVGHVIDAVANTLTNTVTSVTGESINSLLNWVTSTVSGASDAAVTVASLGGTGHDTLSGLIQPLAPVSEVAATAVGTVDHILSSIPIGLEHVHQQDVAVTDVQHHTHALVGTGLI